MSVNAAAIPDDAELIEQFVRTNSESAFRALVERHARWMFASAFRQLRDRQLAEDAAQAVFIILLQKAHAMPQNAKISSWLFRALQFTVKNLRRAQRRRQFHEFRAASRNSDPAINPAETVNDLSDRLDVAVASLHSSDRATILLRFYQNLSFDQIARMLNISEPAARKRTNRAIQALRQKLGINTSPDSIALGAAFGLDRSSTALTHTITTGVLAAKAGAAIPATILTATKGTAIFMAATKTKILAAIVIISFLAVPATIIAVHYAPDLSGNPPANDPIGPPAAILPPASPAVANVVHEPWEIENISSYAVSQLPPEVRIVPTKFPHSNNTRVAGVSPAVDKFVGIRVQVRDIATIAYNSLTQRVIFIGQEPQNRYDFISTLSKDSSKSLQTELKDKLGYVAHRETRDMDVFLLKIKNPNAPGLKPPVKGGRYNNQWNDTDASISWDNEPLSQAPQLLEEFCKMPVIDQTGLTENFSIDVKWKELGDRDPNHNALKQALIKTLGLELVPARAPVEMLIVEKVKP